ncbi:MAG TPA: type II secretion system protein GspL [Gammaproteobacteria bacterium]|nr:type II secretion system protein GspL [Gammaproteobacteria bacterium]
MPETLFVRLTDDHADATWAAFSPDGRLATGVGRGPLAGARAAADGRRAIVLVPALDVTATQAELPSASPSRLRQMLPYTLEDALADDVEQLSFAVGTRLPTGRALVAIAAKARIDSWLDAARAAGLAPQALCSEADGVPDVPSTLVLMIQDARIYGRRPGEPPFVFEGLGIRQILELLRGTGEAEAADLKHLLVYVDAPGRSRYHAELVELGETLASIDVKLAPDGLFTHLAATLAQRPGTNLLQGAYAPKSNWAALARPWRVAASLAAVAAALALVAQGVQYWSLQRTDSALTARLAEECPRLLGVTRPQACEVEVRERLRNLGASHGAGFLGTLAAIAGARGAATRIDALSYRNGTMDLQVVAPDLSTLDDFTKRLQATGRFKPVLESSSQKDTGTEGRMKISQ